MIYRILLDIRLTDSLSARRPHGYADRTCLPAGSVACAYAHAPKLVRDGARFSPGRFFGIVGLGLALCWSQAGVAQISENRYKVITPFTGCRDIDLMREAALLLQAGKATAGLALIKGAASPCHDFLFSDLAAQEDYAAAGDLRCLRPAGLDACFWFPSSLVELAN